MTIKILQFSRSKIYPNFTQQISQFYSHYTYSDDLSSHRHVSYGKAAKLKHVRKLGALKLSVIQRSPTKPIRVATMFQLLTSVGKSVNRLLNEPFTIPEFL